MIKKPSHKMITTVYLIIFLYIVAGLLLYKYQQKLIFRPTPLNADHRFDFSTPFKEYKLPLNDTDRLSVILLKAEAPKGVVIYFHGNTGNIDRYAPYAKIFLDHHYDVMMMDYPGYGKSTGPRSEFDLYNDALITYQLARSYYSADSIIVYGKSLGTAMASRVASLEKCKALVLECPFYSFDELARHYLPIYPVSWLLRYHFSVDQFLKHTTAPVMIFHGTRDEVIPYKQAKKLEPLLKAGDRFITLPDAHHNDLYKQPLYTREIDSLLSGGSGS